MYLISVEIRDIDFDFTITKFNFLLKTLNTILMNTFENIIAYWRINICSM